MSGFEEVQGGDAIDKQIKCLGNIIFYYYHFILIFINNHK